MAARFGHGEQGEHGMVASHVAAGGGQIAKIGTFKIQGETGSGLFATGGDGVVHADGAVDGVELVSATPFAAWPAYVQGQIRFRRAVHADRVDCGVYAEDHEPGAGFVCRYTGGHAYRGFPFAGRCGDDDRFRVRGD